MDREKERRNNAVGPPGKKNKGGKGGWIKCDKPNLNLPKKVYNQDTCMCKSHMKMDSDCHFGENFNNCHNHFNDLTRNQQKSIVKMVDKDNKVNFVGIDGALLKELREEIAAGNNS
jgi:hypothetical protein